jgi:putative transposase
MAIKKDMLHQPLEWRDPQAVFSKDGLFDELKKALAGRVLNAELDDHLEGEAAEGRTNRRNGYSKKTVLTETAKIDVRIPRDREGTFDPKLIQRYQRRFPGFDDKIVSMYARGMSGGEIQGHLAELYGIDVSPDLISTVTDAVLETVCEWQNRPLKTSYPLVFFDALRVKIRDEGAGPQQGSLCRAGRGRRWDQGRARLMDREHLGSGPIKVLADRWIS